MLAKANIYTLKHKKHIAALKEVLDNSLVKMNKEGIKESKRLNKLL